MRGPSPQPEPRETGPRRAGALALASLALLGAVPGLFVPEALAQGLPQADLEVISFDPGTPRVNQTADLFARVRNNGLEEPLAFSVVFGFGNASVPLAANSTVSYPQDQGQFSDAQNANGTSEPGCLSPLGGLKLGCSVRVRFTWTPAFEQRGAKNLSATAQVGSTYGDPKRSNDNFVIAAFIAHHQWSLTLDPKDDHLKQVRPGDAAFYRLTLRNQGNLVDNATLLATSEQWAGASLTQARATLAPGESLRFLAFMAASPGDAEPGLGKANVTANATVAPDLGSARVALGDTQRLAGLNVNLGFRHDVPAELFVASGGTSNLTLRFRNTGGTEDAVKWRLDMPLPPGWNITFPEPWVGLDAPAQSLANVTLQVVTNASLLPGASLAVHLNATSRNGAQNVSANVTLRTAASDLQLRSFVADRAAIYRGDDVLLQADVRNVGQAPMPKTTRLTVQAVNGSDIVSVGEVLFGGLGPGEARTLLVVWRTGNLSGAFDLIARVDPDDEIPEGHEDDNNITLPVIVRLHGLVVEAPPGKEVRPSDRVAFDSPGFRVRNLGNAPEEVVLVLGTEHGWANATERVRLGPGGQAEVPFTIQVPALPGTLSEAVRATATLVNRSATRSSAQANLSILDREAPLLVRLEAPSFVELGTTAEFRVTLRDAVGVRNATLHLRLPDATQRSHALELRAPEVWAATVVLAQPGAVSFWVTAVDATPSNNTLDTSNSVQALLVGVRSAPIVELLEPGNNTAIRSGTPIRLRITDVHGIGEVAVREGGRTFSVEAPYTIGTAGLEEGPHTFEVIARNRFGNPATERFTFTIDDTPPRVQEARVIPPRPAPGQEFRVEAKVSRDAGIAVVQVLRDGLQQREVPARTGLGEVSANLSLAEAGRYVLVVRVEDVAGNVASLDIPVDVGAGLPGPGLLAAALALGLGALARRRR